MEPIRHSDSTSNSSLAGLRCVLHFPHILHHPVLLIQHHSSSLVPPYHIPFSSSTETQWLRLTFTELFYQHSQINNCICSTLSTCCSLSSTLCSSLSSTALPPNIVYNCLCQGYRYTVLYYHPGPRNAQGLQDHRHS